MHLLSLVLFGSMAVSPKDKNVAINGISSQDSTYGYSSFSGSAMNAIDGNNNTDFSKGSCTHTSGNNPPYWKLDLRRPYKISYVVLTNRGDCCRERLLGAEVRIGPNYDLHQNPLCGRVTSISDITLTFCCFGLEGQYVSVSISERKEMLTLCEVEVYEYTRDSKPCK